MKLGICAIVKNENQYVDEWIDYHLKMVDHIYIYDNQSDVPINPRDNVSVKLWTDNEIGSQMRAYEDLDTDCDLVAYIDIDEFICTKSPLKKVLERLQPFDGLVMSWRMYGNDPYFTERRPQQDYKKYKIHNLVKSFIRPERIVRFPDPHFAIIDGIYIDEYGIEATGPHKYHTSDRIWIKHIYTRSLPEWKEKIKRGSGDKVERKKTLEYFFSYNKNFTHEDGKFKFSLTGAMIRYKYLSKIWRIKTRKYRKFWRKSVR